MLLQSKLVHCFQTALRNTDMQDASKRITQEDSSRRRFTPTWVIIRTTAVSMLAMAQVIHLRGPSTLVNVGAATPFRYKRTWTGTATLGVQGIKVRPAAATDISIIRRIYPCSPTPPNSTETRHLLHCSSHPLWTSTTSLAVTKTLPGKPLTKTPRARTV